jgi:hypothetical protein
MKINGDYFKSIFAIVATIVTLFATVIGIIFLINTQVTKQVERIASSEEFLNNLSSKINPFMIFDENNSIIVDRSGDYIDSIFVITDDFIPNKNIDKVPVKIKITPSIHLPNAPMLQCLDVGDDYKITSKRGKKYNWIYELEAINIAEDSTINKFRIDIIL